MTVFTTTYICGQSQMVCLCPIKREKEEENAKKGEDEEEEYLKREKQSKSSQDATTDRPGPIRLVPLEGRVTGCERGRGRGPVCLVPANVSLTRVEKYMGRTDYAGCECPCKCLV